MVRVDKSTAPSNPLVQSPRSEHRETTMALLDGERVRLQLWGVLYSLGLILLWIGDYVGEKLGNAILFMLEHGPTPKHTAIVLDGNRRGAQNLNLKIPFLGHLLGSYTLDRYKRILSRLGAECSAYALSTHNIRNRTPEELEMIAFLIMFMSNRTIWNQEMKIRIVGIIDRLPPKVQFMLRYIKAATQHCGPTTVNMCLGYSSQEMIADVALKLKPYIQNGDLLSSDITGESLEYFMSIYESVVPVDLFFRTSGEVRFSDFMLWQSTHAVLCWEKATLPEIGLWHYVKHMLYYQRHKPRVEAIKAMQEKNCKGRRVLDDEAWARVKRVAKLLEEERKAEIDRILSGYRGELQSVFRMASELCIIRRQEDPALTESRAGLVKLFNKIKEFVHHNPTATSPPRSQG